MWMVPSVNLRFGTLGYLSFRHANQPYEIREYPFDTKFVNITFFKRINRFHLFYVDYHVLHCPVILNSCQAPFFFGLYFAVLDSILCKSID